MRKRDGGDESVSTSPEDLRAFEVAIRDLVGVALRSIEGGDVEVTLPQLRLLMVLNEEGTVSSSQAARALGVAASTVTRLADRLLASGHLRRGADRSNRSVVTLESTARGRAVVEQVNARRQDELRRILDQLDPTERSDCAATLRRIHECLDGTSTPPVLSSLLR
ncbi:MarR family winged helix-turn-helix transcriptional regulator [Rhodococcus sp. NM-2]|uniref:MarR family winged helix-turn-helix transcriptional regulator n=1 Tax=Rhodococcus sp. NM-2 TaxID=3401174 RepID=UPI003AB10067